MVSTSRIHVIPAKAGTHFATAKGKWIPAWPFLETSPFGLVFAGMTIRGLDRLGVSSPESSPIPTSPARNT